MLQPDGENLMEEMTDTADCAYLEITDGVEA